MIIKVLVDNNTLIDKYFMGEPALSFYIETDKKKILFDTGYSGLFIQNAKLMGILLEQLDYIILSHGHNDHTGGLTELIKILTNRPILIAHPNIFKEKYDEDNSDIGIKNFCAENHFKLSLSKEPLWLDENLVFLGEIPRTNDFEAKENIGFYNDSDNKKPDFLYDDSALAYKSAKGINIITGCSHSGIINIINYAQKVCKINEINSIIGGFHLADENQLLITKTVQELQKYKSAKIYPCHCTGFRAKCELAKSFYINEIGVSSEIVL